MSDSGTDAFVGTVAVLFVVVAVVTAAQGRPLTPSPTSASSGRTTTVSSAVRSTASPAPRAGSNIPGGPLLGCTGDVISNETTASGGRELNLKVYYTSDAGGRNCAVAAKVGSTARQPGRIRITLRFADSKSTRWPDYAEQRTSTAARRTGAVYLEDTDRTCVRADATFTPSSGAKPVVVSSSRTGCG